MTENLFVGCDARAPQTRFGEAASDAAEGGALSLARRVAVGVAPGRTRVNAPGPMRTLLTTWVTTR